jgi:hypothetical protein
MHTPFSDGETIGLTIGFTVARSKNDESGAMMKQVALQRRLGQQL